MKGFLRKVMTFALMGSLLCGCSSSVAKDASQQPEEDELILTVHGKEGNVKLLISADA